MYFAVGYDAPVQEHCKWCKNVIKKKKFFFTKGNTIFMIKMNLRLTKRGFHFFRPRNTISFLCQKKPFGRATGTDVRTTCAVMIIIVRARRTLVGEGRKVDFPIWTRRKRPERAEGGRKIIITFDLNTRCRSGRERNGNTLSRKSIVVSGR